MIRVGCLLIGAILASPVQALTLAFPGSSQKTAEQVEPAARTALPVAVWRDGSIDLEPFEGAITRTAWRIGGMMATTTQLTSSFRKQLSAAGYEIAFECRDQICGGFDFRFATDTLGAPAMHVDIGDYVYILAKHPDGDAAALMISRNLDASFVQLTKVTEKEVAAPRSIVASTKSELPKPTPDLIAKLLELGRAPLDDLAFPTGSSSLADGDFASLKSLAEYLADNPARQVVLVGHSDTAGGLALNVPLSQRRAASVRQRLITTYGVPARQITAEGIGFLAPRTTNTTEEGRRANRRVEVVLNN